MKFRDGVKFEVCDDCSDDNPVVTLGLELAHKNGCRCIS